MTPAGETDRAGAPAHADVGESTREAGAPTSRRKLWWAVAAVHVLLIIVVLLVYLGRSDYLIRGGDEIAGLKPLLVITGPGRGEHPEFERPMGAVFGNDGRIYAVDTGNNRVVIFGRNGRYMGEFGGFGVAKPLPGYRVTWEEGLLNFPLGIDVDREGNVYVADFRNDQIQVYDADGAFLRRFPEPTTVVGRGASGQGGTGIAVTDVVVVDDFVFAADTYQVVVFTRDGEFVRQFGRPGSGPGEFDHLTGITATRDGLIIVADSNNDRVQVLTSRGEHVRSIGVPAREAGSVNADIDGPTPYRFGLPRSVAVMDDGTIAVLDAFDFSIVLFDRSGEPIGRYGSRGDAPGQLRFPNSVFIDGDKVLVSDKENDRVQVLEIVR